MSSRARLLRSCHFSRSRGVAQEEVIRRNAFYLSRYKIISGIIGTTYSIGRENKQKLVCLFGTCSICSYLSPLGFQGPQQQQKRRELPEHLNNRDANQTAGTPHNRMEGGKKVCQQQQGPSNSRAPATAERHMNAKNWKDASHKRDASNIRDTNNGGYTKCKWDVNKSNSRNANSRMNDKNSWEYANKWKHHEQNGRQQQQELSNIRTQKQR